MAASTAAAILAEDIGALAMPDVPAGSPLRSLSKPAFNGTEPGLFICGTEDQSSEPDRRSGNRLVLGRVDLSRGELATRASGGVALWTYPLPDHVRDVQWLHGSNAVLAVGSSLVLVRPKRAVRRCWRVFAMVDTLLSFAQAHVRPGDGDALSCELVVLPEFHTDVIRELCVNPANTVRAVLNNDVLELPVLHSTLSCIVACHRTTCCPVDLTATCL